MSDQTIHRPAPADKVEIDPLFAVDSDFNPNESSAATGRTHEEQGAYETMLAAAREVGAFTDNAESVAIAAFQIAARYCSQHTQRVNELSIARHLLEYSRDIIFKDAKQRDIDARDE